MRTTSTKASAKIPYDIEEICIRSSCNTHVHRRVDKFGSSSFAYLYPNNTSITSKFFFVHVRSKCHNCSLII